jgi:hypothetical protein
MFLIRFLARLLAILAVVLGVGVGLAWAWDRSDPPAPTQAAQATLP